MRLKRWLIVLAALLLPLAPASVLAQTPSRTLLTANTTFYINGSTGNDANACTSTAKCKTLSHARQYVQDNYEITSAVQVVFDVAGVTYTNGLMAVGPILGQFGTGGEKWLLHTGTFLNVGGNPNGAIGAFYGANFILSAPEGGVTISANGTNGVCIAAGGTGAAISIQSNITYSTCSAATLYTGVGGSIYADYGMTLAGIQQTMLWASATGGIIQVSGSVTCSGAPIYTTAFAWGYFGGAIGTEGADFSGCTATGKRSLASMNGIVANSSMYPGNVAGTTTTGGQYTGPGP